jgi:hypothetical protein
MKLSLHRANANSTTRIVFMVIGTVAVFRWLELPMLHAIQRYMSPRKVHSAAALPAEGDHFP